MTIEVKDLLALMTGAVDAGVQRYVRSVDPLTDNIKQNEAKRYLRRLGFKACLLQRWVDAGLLTPVKTGDAQNAPVTYSLADIKLLVNSLRLKRIINDNMV